MAGTRRTSTGPLAHTDHGWPCWRCTAATSRARWPGFARRAQKEAGNAEVRFTRNDLAVLAAADDAEPLNEEMFRTAPEVPGFLLPESGRLRYAFLLQRRGDPRARGLIEESETRVRARIASGDLAAATFMEAGVARALVGDANGALAELQRAYDAGWRDYGIAAIDPMLAAVRDDPGSVRWSIAPGPTWPRSVSAPGSAGCSILRRCSDVRWSRRSAPTLRTRRERKGRSSLWRTLTPIRKGVATR